MEKDRTKICGIMIEHGANDFGYWEGFNLSEEDEEKIWNILAKYDTEGYSVRGTRKEVLKDIM